jgi:hypothetical protein
MSFLRALFLSMMIMCAAALNGCCTGGPDVKAETKATTTTTTLGTELKDLKDAYDQGIISEREYNEAKKKLLEQRTKNP